MCMMSVVTAYGQGIPDHAWTVETWRQFQGIAAEVERLDTDLGEPECVDPGKAEWMERIEARIQALEAAQFRADSSRAA